MLKLSTILKIFSIEGKLSVKLKLIRVDSTTASGGIYIQISLEPGINLKSSN